MVSGYICLILLIFIGVNHEGLRYRTKEALKALNGAVENQNTNELVLRTNNCTQFRSRKFKARITEFDISHERILVNIPEEDDHIERFHGTLKRAEVYQKHYRSNPL
jgi:putative transposase